MGRTELARLGMPLPFQAPKRKIPGGLGDSVPQGQTLPGGFWRLRHLKPSLSSPSNMMRTTPMSQNSEVGPGRSRRKRPNPAYRIATHLARNMLAFGRGPSTLDFPYSKANWRHQLTKLPETYS
jgi:hypothetical protein